jgi:hypothetical protein
MKRLIVAFALVFNLFAAEGMPDLPEGADDTSEGSPLFNFIKAVEWKHLIKTLQITADFETCQYTNNNVVGVKASITVPSLIVESSPTYGYSISLETQLMSAEPLKQGVTTSEGGGMVYTHGFGFNPMGLVFKDNLKGALCVPTGAIISPVYLSELPGIDQFCKDDFKAIIFFADIILMINPISILAGAIDCANSEALNTKFDNPLGGAWKGLAIATTPFFFSNGCQGVLPVSCHTAGKDQISEAVGQAARVIAFLHRTNVLQKTSNFLPSPSSMCTHQTYNSYPKAQYRFQLAYPTVGEVHQMGVGPQHFAMYANKITGEGGTAVYIWQKMDYVAFAAGCTGAGKKSSGGKKKK